MIAEQFKNHRENSMSDAENQEHIIVHPKIKEFTTNLGLLLQRDERLFISGSGAEKLEKVLLASDDLLEPDGNFILLNIDLTFKALLQI